MQCVRLSDPVVPLLAIRVELRWAIVGAHATLSRGGQFIGTSASGVKCAGEPNRRRRRQHSTAMGVQQQGDGGTAGGDGYARD